MRHKVLNGVWPVERELLGLDDPVDEEISCLSSDILSVWGADELVCLEHLWRMQVRAAISQSSYLSERHLRVLCAPSASVESGGIDWDFIDQEYEKYMSSSELRFQSFEKHLDECHAYVNVARAESVFRASVVDPPVIRQSRICPFVGRDGTAV